MLSSSNSDNDSSSSSSPGLQVKESHILQERKIGVIGAVSLIVNKIIGAGYVALIDLKTALAHLG